jgi:hypothetical protein
MAIALTCLSCQAKMTAPDSAGGRTLHCPKCGNLILIPSTSGNAWNDPEINVTTKAARPKKKRIVLAKKKRSFPFLQVGICVICLVAVVGLSMAAYSYVSWHLKQKEIEKLAKEEKVLQLAKERQEFAQANTDNFLKSQQGVISEREKYQRQAEENTRIFMEQQEKVRQEAQARQDKIEEEKKKQQEEIRKQFEQQKKQKEIELAKQKEKGIIEEDHKTILAYRKLHVQTTSRFVNLTWDAPVEAVGDKGEKGKLYRVEGVLLNEIQRITTTYYFFLVNRRVAKWQNGEAKLTICKIE